MRCLFCKNNSDDSRSVEHIVPESLGNVSYTLPKGVVCDKCNNYFSRKVEKPFLDLEAMKILRFHQIIPSKRGNVPSVYAIFGDYSAIVNRHLKGPFAASIGIHPQAVDHVMNEKRGTVVFPPFPSLPTGPIVSRFLAKIALEAMAFKLVEYPEGLDYLVDETQLDLIRNHARYGQNIEWPFNSRTIYDSDKTWIDQKGNEVQVVHEFDVFKTEAGEYYFILSIFGMEFAINYAGPEVGGYIQWLKDNDNASPLYYGKKFKISEKKN